MASILRAAALALLLACAAAHAQPPDALDRARLAVSQFRIDGWQTEQGLPQNTVQAVLQSSDGHLWVGTGGGLARFDGTRFATFESSALPELATRPIFGFMEDRDGALWIGHSRGASRFRQGLLERVIPDELMDGRRVWAFAQGADGVVWAASENGLVRWAKGELRLFTEADGLPTRRLRTLAFDRDGTLWIGTTGRGLLAYRGGRFEVLDPSRGFPHLEVRHVLADPSGGIWAATAGAGLVRVGPKGELRTYGVADGLPTDQLTALARDTSGALWIGTWGEGVSLFAGGRFTTVASGGGLGGDQVWTVHGDREGAIWIGTWHGGLDRLSPRPFLVFGKPEGLAGDNVRSVLHARDGSTWVAIAGGGVNRIDKGAVTAAITRREGLPSDEASAVFEDTDGAIWVATYTGGVARIHEGRVRAFGLREGLPNVDVRVMHRDRAGTLWAGTVQGLARFEGGRFAAAREPGAPREGIVSILEARDGTLWLGTAGEGLYRLRAGKWGRLTRSDGLASNWIMALHEDAAGTLWIGTNGEGLSRLRDGRVTSIRTSDGLWDGLTQAILEDRDGRLWMTCNRGFFRVARADLDAFAEGRLRKVESVGYGPGDALRTSTFAGNVQPAGAVDAQGHLWLPSLKGLVVVDPRRLPGSGDPPPVVVDEVSVDGAPVASQGGVVLPPGPALLGIRYFAGTLLHADRVRFRYRLEGISPQWVDAGRGREATFPALPHGEYRFHVAASLDGKRWQEATPFAITVQPRFWQAGWFLGIAAVAAFLLGWALVQWRLYSLRRRAAEMERLVATRTEELRVANEHLSMLSFADPLTGLGNRRRLDQMLDVEWRRGARAGTSLAVVIADIDAFKAYNDSLGHPQGDRCLAEVAQVIRDNTHRAGDFAARYGGEEFVILVPGADHAGALALAEQLRAAVEARAIPHPASSVAGVITISLGVAAVVPTADATSATLIDAADAALYRAKEEGRNRAR